MKKTILIVCLLCFNINFNYAEAKSFSVSEQATGSISNQKIQKKPIKLIKNDKDSKFMKEFKRRVNASNKYNGPIGGDLAAPVTSMDPYTQKKLLDAEKARKNKTIFGDIYKKALGKLGIEKEDSYEQSKERGRIYTIQDQLDILNQRNRNNKKFVKPDFNTISIKLPKSNKTILAPASEHIPYLFSNIDIMADGSAEITETIIVISENKIITNGLSRIFPDNIINRAGDERDLDINVVSIKKEGIDTDFDIKKIKHGKEIDIFQKDNLAAGVHQYEIKYIVKNIVSFYDDFDELYWDITGNSWGLVVARAGAVVNMPSGTKVISQAGFAGRDDSNGVIIKEISDNRFVYMANSPLFIAQNMQLFISLEKGAIYPPIMKSKISDLFNKYGSILISIIAMLVIILYYNFKKFEIKKESKIIANSIKNSIPQNISPAIARVINNNSIDINSFIASLVNIESKSVIEINIDNDVVTLIKVSDDYAKLSDEEIAICKKLFGGNETKFVFCKDNALKIKRALTSFANIVKAKVGSQIFKINVGYILFGVLIYILSLVALSMVQVNVMFSLMTSIIAGISLIITAFLSVMIFNKNLTPNLGKSIKKLIGKKTSFRIIKYIAGIIFLLTSLYMINVLSVEIGLVNILIIVLTPFVIAIYSNLFISLRKGNKNLRAIVSSYINYLEQKKDIAFSPEFINKNIAYAIATEKYNGISFKNKDISKLINLISKEII